MGESNRDSGEAPDDDSQFEFDTEPEPTTADASTTSASTKADHREYWRRNLKLIGILLAVWFTVSFLAGIVLARPLTDVYIGEVPVAFWMAQQGSIIVFVLIIFVYAWRMNKLDREFGVHE